MGAKIVETVTALNAVMPVELRVVHRFRHRVVYRGTMLNVALELAEERITDAGLPIGVVS